MRGKLLRALAHLKAAHRHLQRAALLIRSCYLGDFERRAIEPVWPVLEAARKMVRERLAEEIEAHTEPAELPR